MRLLLFGAIVQFIVKSSASTNFTQCEDPGTNGVLASLRPHLYLICMLVATAEPLASHFVSHYATLGVPHVNMNMYVDTSQGAPAAHARILASARVALMLGHIKWSSFFIHRSHSSAWVVWKSWRATHRIARGIWLISGC